jgi:hypothetical protein
MEKIKTHLWIDATSEQLPIGLVLVLFIIFLCIITVILRIVLIVLVVAFALCKARSEKLRILHHCMLVAKGETTSHLPLHRRAKEKKHQAPVNYIRSMSWCSGHQIKKKPGVRLLRGY